MKKNDPNLESTEEIRTLFEQRGRRSSQMARKALFDEDFECIEIREAVRYFAKEWHDLARPTLLSLACEAVGGDPCLTDLIAIPMSLIAAAADIHDDIIDQSERKYNKSTVYGKFGREIALLVGDALFFKAFALISEFCRKIPAEKATAILVTVKDMFFESGDGQSLELRLRGRFDVMPNEYLKIAEKKAADVEAHTRIGAIIGGGTESEIEALGRYGRYLGLLIILGDDITDMVDHEELIHRIEKEHLPMPIVYAMKSREVKRKIESIILKRAISKADAKDIINIVCDAGGLAQLEETMKHFIAKGTSALPSVKGKKAHLATLIQSTLPQKNERQDPTGASAKTL